jgi:YVTN family beta-propeller protein
MYVVGDQTNSVTIINHKNNVIADLALGSSPQVATYDPQNGMTYIPNLGDGTVSVISPSNTIKATIPVGLKPADSIFVPSNNEVYVTNQGSGTVSVLSS